MLRLKVKVGPKAQVVIPQPIREEFGIRPGDEVHFSVEGSRIILEVRGGEEWLKRFLSIVPPGRRIRGSYDSDAAYDEMMRERDRRRRARGR